MRPLTLLKSIAEISDKQVAKTGTYSVLYLYIQCLLKVDGSILAAVFLTSSFCVAPESSYSSNAESNSLLVAWSSNCSIAASIVLSQQWVHSKTFALEEAAAETGSFSAPAQFM